VFGGRAQKIRARLRSRSGGAHGDHTPRLQDKGHSDYRVEVVTLLMIFGVFVVSRYRQAGKNHGPYGISGAARLGYVSASWKPMQQHPWQLLTDAFDI
jgi:hypothetical protein